MAAHILSECEPGRPTEIPCDAAEIWAYTRSAPDKDGGNQDRAAIFPRGAGMAVVAVADGLGGMPSGDQAAELAIRALGDQLTSAEEGAPLRTCILDAFETANKDILALGGGAGTTFAVAELEGGRLRTYHVGDSAVLVVGQRGRIKLATLPHSPVGYGVAAGLIKPADAIHHDDLHFLSNHLGAADMHIQVGSPISLAARDTVLLATDGLFDNLHMPEIVQRIRKGPLAKAARSLAGKCVARMEGESDHAPAKPDDATFVLLRAARGAVRGRRSAASPGQDDR